MSVRCRQEVNGTDEHISVVPREEVTFHGIPLVTSEMGVNVSLSGNERETSPALLETRIGRNHKEGMEWPPKLEGKSEVVQTTSPGSFTGTCS